MGKAVPPSDQYVMIIGAMKSATSALFDLLVQHPAVCPSVIKEPEFFSAGQSHGIAVRDYADLFDFDDDVHRVALEASTGYAKYPAERGVPQRIAEEGLNPRFIYVVRDPVDRIASQVAYGSWGRRGAAADFEDEEAIAISSYAMQLDQYCEYFPRERILVVRQDHLARDPLAVTGRIFEFLELAPAPITPPGSAKNAARPRSGWERRLMRSGRLAKLAAGAPAPLRDAMRRLSALGSGPRPEMPEVLRQSLRDRLAGDMARLETEWGIEVADWGFDTATSQGLS